MNRDSERRIKDYSEEIERERVEDEERKECRRFIKENGVKQKVGKEENEMEEEEKRKNDSKEQERRKIEMKEDLIQKKLTETWSRLLEWKKLNAKKIGDKI